MRKRLSCFCGAVLWLTAFSYASGCTLKIVSPNNNTRVGLEGGLIVNASISDGEYVWAMTRQVGGSNYTWLDQLTRNDRADWLAKPRYGSAADGAGRQFELLVIVVDQDVHRRLLQKKMRVPTSPVESELGCKDAKIVFRLPR